MGSRYNLIEGKFNREIVLLKSFPCIYGKCSFCNYIEDNSEDEDFINKFNINVLKEVKGTYRELEVINSGSVFELPQKTLEEIKKVVIDKNINVLYFEIYYSYINRLEEIKKFFEIKNLEIRFRLGMETFDNDFRKNIYNKNFIVNKKILNKIKNKIYSVCLLICVKGQTKEMIKNDIKMALDNFKAVTINVFVNNGTVVERDEDLVKWFVNDMSYLFNSDRVEILIDNKDLGVYEQ